MDNDQELLLLDAVAQYETVTVDKDTAIAMALEQLQVNNRELASMVRKLLSDAKRQHATITELNLLYASALAVAKRRTAAPRKPRPSKRLELVRNESGAVIGANVFGG
jgi:hypothetical protein